MVSVKRSFPIRALLLVWAASGWLCSPAQAQARFWSVPGTAGKRFERVAWEQTATGAWILAWTPSGELVRVDPLNGAETVVARRVSAQGVPEKIGQVVADQGVIDFVNRSRNLVERIDRDGHERVLAGGGAVLPATREPISASSAALRPAGIALGPDGTRFLSSLDGSVAHILLFTPAPGQPGEGSLRIIAGQRHGNLGDTQLDARDACLSEVKELASVRKGGITFVDERYLLELAPYVDGLGQARWQLLTTAGKGSWANEPVVDCADARKASLFPEGIASGSEGTRYLRESNGCRVRKLCPNEDGLTLTCATLVGTGVPAVKAPGPDGALCRGMAIRPPKGLAAIPGGGVLLATDDGLHYLGPDTESDDHLAALVQYAVLAARHHDRAVFEALTMSLRRYASPETQGFANLSTSLGQRLPDDLVEGIASFGPFNPVTAMRAQMALNEILRQAAAIPGFAAEPYR